MHQEDIWVSYHIVLYKVRSIDVHLKDVRKTKNRGWVSEWLTDKLKKALQKKYILRHFANHITFHITEYRGAKLSLDWLCYTFIDFIRKAAKKSLHLVRPLRQFFGLKETFCLPNIATSLLKTMTLPAYNMI